VKTSQIKIIKKGIKKIFINKKNMKELVDIEKIYNFYKTKYKELELNTVENEFILPLTEMNFKTILELNKISEENDFIMLEDEEDILSVFVNIKNILSINFK
jgi:hypothetical protein